jgi:hypothetical protein
VIRPKDSILTAPAFAEIASEVARLVGRFAASNTHLWRSRLVAEPVDAILLTARVPALLATTGHLVIGTNIHLEPISQV